MSAVATTIEPAGLGAFGSSASRFRTPCALSAEHIDGSQDTWTLEFTCWATQAAARLRVAVVI